MNKNFSGIGDALGIPFIEEQHPVVVQQVVETLPIETKNDSISLTDEEYLRLKSKEAIEASVDILNTLKNEVKIGSTPRMFEAFAKVADTVTGAISELRELNKNSASIKIAKNKRDIKIENMNVQQNNVALESTKKFTSSDIYKMLADAEKESSVNEVNAEFNLSDEKLI